MPPHLYSRFGKSKTNLTPVQAALSLRAAEPLDPGHWTVLLFACTLCLFYTVPLEPSRGDEPVDIG